MKELFTFVVGGATIITVMGIVVSFLVSVAWALNPIAALLVVLLIVAGGSGGYYAYSQEMES